MQNMAMLSEIQEHKPVAVLKKVYIEQNRADLDIISLDLNIVEVN